MVCTDGSPASQIALDTISSGLLRKEDFLAIGHAWSMTKEEYLPYNLKRDYIQDQNNAAFIYLGKQYSFCEEII